MSTNESSGEAASSSFLESLASFEKRVTQDSPSYARGVRDGFDLGRATYEKDVKLGRAMGLIAAIDVLTRAVNDPQGGRPDPQTIFYLMTLLAAEAVKPV